MAASRNKYLLSTKTVSTLPEKTTLLGEPGRAGESDKVERSAAMIPLEQMTDEQFERHALDILCREFGVDGLARFLRVYRAGSGDYTRERHRWLQTATVRDIAREFEQGIQP
jgi:hypothetical protein